MDKAPLRVHLGINLWGQDDQREKTEGNFQFQTLKGAQRRGKRNLPSTRSWCRARMRLTPRFAQRTILQVWKLRLRGLRPCYSKPRSLPNLLIQVCSHRIPGDACEEYQVEGAPMRRWEMMLVSS